MNEIYENIMEKVINRELNWVDARILFVVLSISKNNGKARLTKRKLEDLTHLVHTNLKHSIRRLEEKNMLRVVEGNGKDGGNFYTINKNIFKQTN